MDSPEHRALTQCYSKLCSCIQQSPTDVAARLKPYKILASGDWAFITSSQSNNEKKALRIVDAVLNQVQLDSQVFCKFVSALEVTGSWTKKVVCELQYMYTALLHESGKQGPGIWSQCHCQCGVRLIRHAVLGYV